MTVSEAEQDGAQAVRPDLRRDNIRPQVVCALLRAHQQAGFLALLRLRLRLRYRPTAAEEGMAAREYLAGGGAVDSG